MFLMELSPTFTAFPVLDVIMIFSGFTDQFNFSYEKLSFGNSLMKLKKYYF